MRPAGAAKAAPSKGALSGAVKAAPKKAAVAKSAPAKGVAVPRAGPVPPPPASAGRAAGAGASPAAAEGAWQLVQKRVFTRWCNAHLRVRSFAVADLYVDLQDGLVLINLLEILFGKPLGARYNRVPRHRVQRMENCQLALAHIASLGIKLVAIGAEDLVDGNKTLVLGLIWTLILQCIKLGFDSRNDELLKWVQGQIPQCGVKNLLDDFRDGKAIMALLESVCPGTFELPAQYKSSQENVKRAFDEAERRCAIPQLLDVQDMVNGVDDLSNRAYISFFRDYVLSRTERNLELRPAVVMEQAARAEPDESEVWCLIRGKDHSYRANIALDGTVSNKFGTVLGFVNLAGAEVAMPDETYLGCVDAGGLILDDKDECVGSIDRGTGAVLDANGNTVFQLDGTGRATGQTTVYLGEFLRMGYRQLTHIALYVLFLDPTFAKEDTP